MSLGRSEVALARGWTTNAMPDLENETLTLVSINIHGQTGLTLSKQKQIQDCISQYKADIVSCQEINIEEKTLLANNAEMDMVQQCLFLIL